MRVMIVEDGVAIDAVEVPADWTGAEGQWQPPEGTETVASDTALIGDNYDGSTFTTPEPPPPDYSAADWFRMIESRADTELQRGVSVTINGTTYGIRTGPQALALIDGAAIRADVAKRKSQTVMRRVPTDQGIVQFDGPALWSIFEAVESHQQAVSERAETLQAMVADGTISEAELETWP